MLWCCVITNNHVCCTQIGPLCSWVPRTYRREEGLQRLKNLHFSMILVSSATSQFDSRRSQRQSERWWQGWWLWDQRVLQMQQVYLSALAQNILPHPELPLQGWPLCQRVPQLHWSPTSWQPQGSYICQRRRQRLWKRGSQGRRQRIWNKQMSQV